MVCVSIRINSLDPLGGLFSIRIISLDPLGGLFCPSRRSLLWSVLVLELILPDRMFM